MKQRRRGSEEAYAQEYNAQIDKGYLLQPTASELARYIAAYVNEELTRRHKITYQTILDAIDAFEGGAR